MAGRHLDGGGDDLDEAAVRTDPSDRASARPLAAGVRWGVFAGLAIAIIVADQLTKAWIVANVNPDRPVNLIDEYLRLVVSHNTGALFGLFRDRAELFAAVSFAVIGLIVVYQARAGRSLALSTALGLLLGGAIGNLADRVRFGYVIDFVDAGIGGVRWYTFNVADAAISVALLLLIAVTLRPSLAGPSRTDA